MYYARAWYKSVFGVLGANTALNGVSALEQVALLESQLLAVGHTQLLLHQVNAHNLFGYRMLNLQTGVHFEEIKMTVFVNQELYSTCSAVVDGLCGSHCLFAHLLAQLRREERRRTLFNDFLVAALHRAFAVEKMNHVAVGIAKNLELYVMRLLNKFFKINSVVTK
ncbi:choline dehydrogenase [Prevotella sp. CAG:1185]|nr:choline dehydrogenase [Prevotella sp. CAG:1185]